MDEDKCDSCGTVAYGVMYPLVEYYLDSDDGYKKKRRDFIRCPKCFQEYI